MHGNGWEPRTDLSTGDVYYYNTTTKTRSDVKPSELGGDWHMTFDAYRGGFVWYVVGFFFFEAFV